MTPSDQNFFEAQRAQAGLPTTHRSVVLTAADSVAPWAFEALEQLCRTYWRPVYVFVRRQGHSPDDALGLTQAFFARFLERKQVKLANPDRGRLRSFLLISLKNFLANERAHAQAEKRGGGRSLLSLDQTSEAETHFLAEPAELATPPDQAFEKRWALTLLDQMHSRLRDEFSASGGPEQFDALKAFVWGDQTAVSQVEIVAQVGMTPNALGVTVHRLRTFSASTPCRHPSRSQSLRRVFWLGLRRLRVLNAESILTVPDSLKPEAATLFDRGYPNSIRKSSPDGEGSPPAERDDAGCDRDRGRGWAAGIRVVSRKSTRRTVAW